MIIYFQLQQIVAYIRVLRMFVQRHSGKYKSSKKGLECVNKFHYNIDELYPQLQGDTQRKLQTPRTVVHNGNFHFYFEHQVSGNFLTTHQYLLQAGKKVYADSSSSSCKINSTSFKKCTEVKAPYLPVWGTAKEVIDLMIEEEQTNQSHSEFENREKFRKTLILYVIHHCHPDSKDMIKWLNFVEQYRFDSKGLTYRYSASCKQSQEYFSVTNNEKMLRIFVEKCAGVTQMSKVQGFVMKFSHEIEEKIKKLEDPAYHPDHKVITRIPPEHLKTFFNLKTEFPDIDESLICRFMIAKQFNIKQISEGIKKYFQWRKQLTEKYKWEDFEEFDRQGIFRYLGQDRKGRPVIVNKASKVLVDEFDIEKYCMYYIYYLEVYVPAKMRGNTTQVLIIADVEGLGTDHFKFSVTKRNILDSLNYCPERQYKMIGVNVSTFALYWWRICSPLLPKNTLEKISIAGSDTTDIYHALLDEMDEEVIPEYLGGQNKMDLTAPSPPP